VYAITVGSETLYRKNFTGAQLLSKMREVKSQFGQFKVGTADSWNKYADGTADLVIQSNPDILYVEADFLVWRMRGMIADELFLDWSTRLDSGRARKSAALPISTSTTSCKHTATSSKSLAAKRSKCGPARPAGPPMVSPFPKMFFSPKIENAS
jgi:hypothetical protein